MDLFPEFDSELQSDTIQKHRTFGSALENLQKATESVDAFFTEIPTPIVRVHAQRLQPVEQPDLLSDFVKAMECKEEISTEEKRATGMPAQRVEKEHFQKMEKDERLSKAEKDFIRGLSPEQFERFTSL